MSPPRQRPEPAVRSHASCVLALVCLLAPLGCEPRHKPAGRGPTTAGTATKPAPTFLAAVGRSRKADPLAAVEEAAGRARKAFQAAGVPPVAAIFLVGSRGVSAEQFARIGRRARKVTGVATFGQGTIGKQAGPTAMVLVLGGAGLAVKGYVTAGPIEHDDSEAPARAAKVRALRRACAERGEALARQIPPPTKSGLVLLLGALADDWHANFYTALHKQLGPNVPLVGGVGGWGDSVYADGRDLTDAKGKRTSVGQLAVVIQGDLRVAVQPVTFPNRWDPAAVRGEARQAGKVMLGRLRPAQPKLLLAFGCGESVSAVTLANPGVPIFGFPCSGQVGTDATGRLSVGADRLVVCAVAGQ